MLKTKELQDQLAENKKHQLETGGTKWEVNCYLRDTISHCYFLSSKKKGGELAEGVRETFLRDGVPFRDLERLLDWGRMVAIGKRTATKRSDLRRVDIREAKNH